MKDLFVAQNSVGEFLIERGMNEYAPMMNGFVIGGTILILIMSNPFRVKKVCEDNKYYCIFGMARVVTLTFWIMCMIKIVL